MEVKTLARENWARILERDQSFMALDAGPIHGYAGLLMIHRVAKPLSVPVGGNSIKIADDGYAWLQIAPEGENWWLTVMFDEEDRIVQYYFDITLKNEIDGERSKFVDLYLDVVLLPDGRIVLLDQDELDDALSAGEIGNDEYDRAVRTAEKLMAEIPQNRERLESFCRNVFADLRKSVRLERNV